MPIVIASRPDGVGTRLLTLLHAYRFSQHMGWPFTMHWPDLSDQNYSDTQLLASARADDYFPSGRVFKDDEAEIITAVDFTAGKRVYQLSGSVSLKGMTRQQIVELTATYDIFLYDLPEAILLDGTERSKERIELRKNWRRLNFPHDVISACDEVTQGLHWKETVAVHVRRGDVVNMLTRGPLDHLSGDGIVQLFQRYIAFNTVITQMTEHAGAMKGVIVCSEEAGMASRLKLAFPWLSILTGRGRFQDDVNKSTLVDLILLTRSRFIICPPISYFSFCASEASLANRLQLKIDFPNLVPELIAVLDDASPPDIEARKAIIYNQMCKYLENDREAVITSGTGLSRQVG
jgi:hypothetical protein